MVRAFLFSNGQVRQRAAGSSSTTLAAPQNLCTTTKVESETPQQISIARGLLVRLSRAASDQSEVLETIPWISWLWTVRVWFLHLWRFVFLLSNPSSCIPCHPLTARPMVLSVSCVLSAACLLMSCARTKIRN
jgi:hypothetical protein